jgi:hypothetical protein
MANAAGRLLHVSPFVGPRICLFRKKNYRFVAMPLKALPFYAVFGDNTF